MIKIQTNKAYNH